MFNIFKLFSANKKTDMTSQKEDPLFSPEEIEINEDNKVTFSVELRDKLLSKLDSVDPQFRELCEDIILNPSSYKVQFIETTSGVHLRHSYNKYKVLKNRREFPITIMTTWFCYYFDGERPPLNIYFLKGDDYIFSINLNKDSEVYYAIYEILSKRNHKYLSLSKNRKNVLTFRKKQKVAEELNKIIKGEC